MLLLPLAQQKVLFWVIRKSFSLFLNLKMLKIVVTIDNTKLTFTECNKLPISHQ